MTATHEETDDVSCRLEDLQIIRVPLDSLVRADSPRSRGEDIRHVRALLEIADGLPPIVVHHPTMRVIDGMHRVWAAQLRGDIDIEARLFEGDEASAFVLGVSLNIIHGLPLSLADRKAATVRIMASHPDWSDRRIASVAGIAPKTVALLRSRPSDGSQQLDRRLGRDGRRRPVNGTEQRAQVATLLATSPDASLREIARQAGVSPETVRQARARLSQPATTNRTGPKIEGEQTTFARPPVNPAGCGRRNSGKAVSDAARTIPDAELILRALRADPAFRSTDNGRSLLRLLAASYRAAADESVPLLDSVPSHCMSRLADAAYACAHAWEALAQRVEQRIP